jgi:hypothetical protein
MRAGHVDWEFSQEGLRPKGAHRQIGDREIVGTEICDIGDHETLKPEIKSGSSRLNAEGREEV